jgi:hypothetical protein
MLWLDGVLVVNDEDGVLGSGPAGPAGVLGAAAALLLSYVHHLNTIPQRYNKEYC